MKPLNLQRKFLEEATANYQKSLPLGMAYLEERGISEEVADSFRLGFVKNPEPGHEFFTGRISVPYLSRSGVITMKFRRTDDSLRAVGQKYLGLPGARAHLFNVNALFERSDVIAICEGEFDAMIMHGMGIPAVGVPGIDTWKRNEHWPKLFTGYSKVPIFAHNDTENSQGKSPGNELAKQILKDVPQATVVALPENEDVNDCYRRYGSSFLLSRAGLSRTT